jgi:N-acetylneuraminate lyase
MPRFRGVWPALVTPLTESDHVNIPVTCRLVDHLLDAGVHGLYVCGGTGEGVLLPPQERRTLAETVIEQVDHRVPVMVHAGALATSDAIALVQHAETVGADAVSAVPPFYFSVGFEAIKQHYQLIAAATSLPLYLYYIPGTTGVQLTHQQMWELCQIDGVAGFKYSTMDLTLLEQILSVSEGAANVLSGPDQLILPCLALGVDGAIGTTYNILPRHFVRLYQAFQDGRIEVARRLQMQANRVINAFLAQRGGTLPAVKEIMRFLGFDCGYCRRPLRRLSSSEVATLREDLESAGFWELVGG